MTHPIKSPRKLIEVALPLDAINAACQHEKSVPRRGHPGTFHIWWARRPLAAAQAVIFSQMVHDPEDLWLYQNFGKEPNAQVKGHWTKARARLFGIIEELVLWENTTNETVLENARKEIRKSWRETCELNKDHPRQVVRVVWRCCKRSKPSLTECRRYGKPWVRKKPSRLCGGGYLNRSVMRNRAMPCAGNLRRMSTKAG